MKLKLAVLALVILLASLVPSAALAQGGGGTVEVFRILNSNVTPAMEQWLASSGWVLQGSAMVRVAGSRYPMVELVYIRVPAGMATPNYYGPGSIRGGSGPAIVVPGPAYQFECQRIYGRCGTYNYRTGQCYCAW
jgi:hypothetical protein